ncbi:hypothetical protein GQ53DRAFT_243336 [Thozetella sp. PMI_491]|nr:hypothetical protein GQ53DRAFT_243336 [Thozetella sp. PMI_491]
MNRSRHETLRDPAPSPLWSFSNSEPSKANDRAMVILVALTHWRMCCFAWPPCDAVDSTSCLERSRLSSSPSPADVKWNSLDSCCTASGTRSNLCWSAMRLCVSFIDAANREATPVAIDKGSHMVAAAATAATVPRSAWLYLLLNPPRSRLYVTNEAHQTCRVS